jgi:uncharacterized membrane protein YoaK (UPF0700 family)
MIRKNGPILVLAWTSGCLDALGFLELGRVFTANMTGNTVLFGMAIAQGNWLAMLRSLLALLGFSLGVLSGTFLIRHNYEQHEQDWTPQLTRALVAEACLLLLFGLIWAFILRVPQRGLVDNLLIALSALAMGLQSTTILSLGIPGISTTYISGTITTLMANLARRLARRVDTPVVITPIATIQVERQKPIRLITVWLIYIVAAIIGGYGALHFASLVAFLPFVAVVAAIAMHYMPSNAGS